MGILYNHGVPYGGTGFSPSIQEKTNTTENYVLTINNQNGSFDTPNLRMGIGAIEITQAEFDKLPQDVKNSGLYFITDNEGTADSILNLENEIRNNNSGSAIAGALIAKDLYEKLDLTKTYVDTTITNTLNIVDNNLQNLKDENIAIISEAFLNQITVLLNTPITAAGTYELTDSINNYKRLGFCFSDSTESSGYLEVPTEIFKEICTSVTRGFLIEIWDNKYVNFKITESTLTTTAWSGSGNRIVKIIGLN